MARYSAPARSAAVTYRPSSSQNRCQPIAGEHLLPAFPGREPPSAVLGEQGVTRKLSRRRSPASPGAGRPPACFMLPPRELAFSGIDLDAVPVPRTEEVFGRGTFTRPMPGQAAVLGQRGRQVLRPHCYDGAVPAGPHAPGDTYPPAHPPRRSGVAPLYRATRSAGRRHVRTPVRTPLQHRRARRTTSAMCGLSGGGAKRGSTACSWVVNASPGGRTGSSAST